MEKLASKLEQARKKAGTLLGEYQFDVATINKLNEDCVNLGNAVDNGQGKVWLRTQLLKLSRNDLEEIENSLGNVGGSNDYKLQKISLLIFGEDGKAFQAHVEKLQAIIEGIGSVVDYGITQALWMLLLRGRTLRFVRL